MLGLRTLVSTGSRSTAFKWIFSGGFFFRGDFFRGDCFRRDFFRRDFFRGNFSGEIFSGGIFSGGIFSGGIFSGGILSGYRYADLLFPPKSGQIFMKDAGLFPTEVYAHPPPFSEMVETLQKMRNVLNII